MNHDHFFLSFMDLLLKSTAILLVAFTVQYFWRKASAAALNAVWAMAFGALLLLPLTRLAQPRWAASLTEKQPVSVQALPVALPGVQADQVPVEVIPSPAPAAFTLPDSGQLLLGVWILGAGLVMTRRLLGTWQLRRIKRQSDSLQHGTVGELTSRLAREWGVGRAVELRASKEVPVPLTWGTWRPLIMLPQGAVQWHEERLMAALQHELGHIKRYDVLTRGLTDLVCAIYWINPLVWLGAKAMRLTQERACDDLVLNAGASAENYATLLLESARLAQHPSTHRLPALAMAQPSTLETRLLAIVDERRDRRPMNKQSLILASSAGIMTLLMSATMQLRAQDQLPADDSTKAVQQIHISVKVIEAPSATLKSVLQGLDPGKPMSQDQAASTLQKFARLPKTELLSSPSVVTRSGQQAAISIGREHVGQGDEKTFIGTSANLLPTLTDKGEIKLKAEAVTRKLVSEEPKPIFRESKVQTEILLQPDQTVILAGSPAGEDGLENAFLISASLVDASGIKITPADPGAKSAAEAKAKKIILPSIIFQNASLQEAVDFLRIKSKEYDAEKKGINVVIKVPKEALNVTLSLNLKDIPLSEALKYVAQLSNLRLVFNENACVLEALGAAAALSQSTAPSPAPEIAASMNAATKAGKIIIPSVELKAATLTEALEFLRVMSRKYDPENNGVNLILNRAKAWEETGGSEPVLSLSLKDVPLTEALRYVAELSNLKLSVQDNAYVLTAREAPAVAANKKDRPVKLESETVSTNEATGITEASGNVVLTAEDMTVKTDHLTYDRRQQKALANGRVEVTRGSSVTTALGQVEVNLKNGELKVNGTSTVKVR